MRLRTIDLDCSQREALEMGHQQGKKARFRQRCQIILLKSQGRTAKDVGQIVGLSPISVNHWLNRYEARGSMVYTPSQGVDVNPFSIWKKTRKRSKRLCVKSASGFNRPKPPWKKSWTKLSACAP